MELKRTFVNGILDKDSDERMIQPGFMRDALNVSVSNSEGSDVGAIENCLGNEQISSLTLGSNVVTIGGDKDSSLGRIYWLTKSDDRTCFIEYDISTNTTTKILEDTRTGASRVLDLDANYPVHRIIIIVDSDNDNVYACWTDNNDPIRFVNIERAKAYGTNGFDDDDISLIKKPPLNRPEIVLQASAATTENVLEQRFFRFYYRWKYLDGEYSALSPASLVAFEANSFNYNYAENSNEGMTNAFNEVEITFNTGSELVTHVELFYKESRSNNLCRIVSVDKDNYGGGVADNTDITYDFNTLKYDKILPQDEISRYFDNVPLKAFAAEVIDNRLVFGNYTENYDLIDPDSNPVYVDMALDYNATAIANLDGKASVKSIRDYEAGIVYVDDYGRATSVLTSPDAKINIPVADCDKQNKLELTIKHKAPAFASGYRIFVKQSTNSYNQITPTLFYEDGVYRWIKLENGEQDKVNEGDYLVVKSDATGVMTTYVETRVIEMANKEQNFLDADGSATTVEQEAGTYMKIKPNGFSISESDIQQYSFTGNDNTEDHNAISSEANYIEDAIYYGNGTLDDMTSSGTYTGLEDLRYEVEIVSTGTPDSFQWREKSSDAWTGPVAITGAAQTLSNGVQVTFGATTGHDTNDNWIVSAKSTSQDNFGGLEGNNTYIALPGPDGDTIFGGARIDIAYYEYIEGNAEEVLPTSFSSRTYDNIEEWFYGDNIDASYLSGYKYWFRRGTVSISDGKSFFTQDTSEKMCLIIRSAASQNNFADDKVYAAGTIDVYQINNQILFETKQQEVDTDIYYETGPTYTISAEGYHLGVSGDTNQTAIADAVLNLDFFNCFAWGNGFESYRIKDSLVGKAMDIDSRPWISIDEYKQRTYRSGLRWGARLEQSTNYNSLNEFNPASVNSLDLDDNFGSIQYLHSRDTDIVAIQENRIQPLAYKKSQIFDESGNATLIKSDDIFSVMKAYAGEYGCSLSPESIAKQGYRLYMVDTRRGTPLRLSIDGLTELSMYRMKDWFRDIFRRYPSNIYQGAYDPYFDRYMVSIPQSTESDSPAFTIGFDENNGEERKGWGPRQGWSPDKMIGVNNLFFSIKDGQLWQHHSQNVTRNNFYGSQGESIVNVIVNEFPGEDKIYKAIWLDGNDPWDVNLITNLANSTIDDTEFSLKESRYFAYTRRNQDFTDKTSFSTMGLGSITDVTLTTLDVTTVNGVNIGDRVYQINSGAQELIGSVDSISGNTITIDTVVNVPILGSFCFIKKTSRIEGGHMRGYYLDIKLTNTNTEAVELFSVSANTVKSYV